MSSDLLPAADPLPAGGHHGRFEALTSAPTTVADALAFFDELPAVPVDAMLGEWRGGLVVTGHPGEGLLEAIRWVGKRFRGADDVEPMLCRSKTGEIVVNDKLGAATLREVTYRGVPTATMVYDTNPTFDHFRQVSGDLVMGVMDRKGEETPLVFWLRRHDGA